MALRSPPRNPKRPQEPPKTLGWLLGGLLAPKKRPKSPAGRLILLPQINKNPLKIDAKMHSNSGSLFVSILDRFLLENRKEFLFKTVNFSSRFFDVDFALLGKRFSVFCVSIVILRRSHFSRRTSCFLEGICFRAFARRQVK